MGEYISRQAAIDAVIELCKHYTPTKSVTHPHMDFVIEELKWLPSAEPEIIRCKDCKWKQGSECVRFAEVRPFPDDFCSRAERRTDEQGN